MIEGCMLKRKYVIGIQYNISKNKTILYFVKKKQL